MADRLKLQTILEELNGNDNVYFQPPPTFKMKYPCVRYELGTGDVKKADNTIYSYVNNYELMFISNANNMGVILKVLQRLPMARHTSSYIADNLYHYTFSVYY